jgi:hypothetical protein
MVWRLAAELRGWVHISNVISGNAGTECITDATTTGKPSTHRHDADGGVHSKRGLES